MASSFLDHATNQRTHLVNSRREAMLRGASLRLRKERHIARGARRTVKRGALSLCLCARSLQGDVEDAKLRAILALPAIDREVARGMQRPPAVLEQSLAERLARRAKRDRLHARAVPRLEPRANV